MTGQQYRENIRMGLDTLRSHKLRSFLTVLGVIIGVATVIVIASVLTGVRRNILSLVEQYGTDNIYAFHLSSGLQVGARSRRERQRDPLKVEHAQAIKEQADHIADVSYQGFGPQPRLKYRDQEFTNGQMLGVSPNLAENIGAILSDGRFFTEVDDRGRRMVCVLGFNPVDSLFPQSTRAVGKSIMIGGNRFTIIGVLEKAKTSFFGANDVDNVVYLPYRTFRKLYVRAEFLMLIIRAREGHLGLAFEEAESILRRERGLRNLDDNDFTLSTYDSLVEQFDEVVAGIGLLFIAISGVGLLVGGIGVMNIMLVSVTERTREIGVRKALGARRKDITFQFLFEAITLTTAGGVIGVLFAVGASSLVILLVPGLPASIPGWAVVTGFLVSMMVGLIFGVFPAVKASRLDPIECLRYE
ncbi:MAG: ABC transporter permease [Acidobacteriota bacterium]